MCECMTGKTGECGSRVGVGEIESVNPIFKGIALPFLFLGECCRKCWRKCWERLQGCMSVGVDAQRKSVGEVEGTEIRN